MSWTIVIEIIIAITVIGFGFGLVPYLVSKGIINQKNIDQTAQIVDLVAAIAKEIRPEDTVIDKIYKVTDLAIRSAEQFYKAGQNDDKRTYAQNLAERMCLELGLELTENQKVIIRGLIETAVGYLPPSHEIED